MHQSCSLWSQIFEGIYFLKRSFWHAGKGHRPSRGWQSLLEGRDSILESSMWTVETGEAIGIIEDRWLKRGVIGGPVNENDPQQVVELINHKRKFLE